MREQVEKVIEQLRINVVQPDGGDLELVNVSDDASLRDAIFAANTGGPTAINLTGDITLVQMATLLTLDGGPPFGVKALSERLGRSLSATSRLVDQLVRRRLLRRSEDPQDRRGKLLELAPAGRRLVAQLMERRAEAYLQLTERLPPREQAAVARAMTLLAKAGGGRVP